MQKQDFLFSRDDYFSFFCSATLKAWVAIHPLTRVINMPSLLCALFAVRPVASVATSFTNRLGASPRRLQ